MQLEYDHLECTTPRSSIGTHLLANLSPEPVTLLSKEATCYHLGDESLDGLGEPPSLEMELRGDSEAWEEEEEALAQEVLLTPRSTPSSYCGLPSPLAPVQELPLALPSSAKERAWQLLSRRESWSAGGAGGVVKSVARSRSAVCRLSTPSGFSRTDSLVSNSLARDESGENVQVRHATVCCLLPSLDGPTLETSFVAVAFSARLA